MLQVFYEVFFWAVVSVVGSAVFWRWRARRAAARHEELERRRVMLSVMPVAAMATGLLKGKQRDGR